MDFNKAGGAAFPLQFNVAGPATDPITGKEVPAGHTNAHVFVGATLRDYFAAQALQGIVAALMAKDTWHGWSNPDIAKEALNIADCMLAERVK